MTSAPLLSPAFAEILRQNRARYNALFTAARLNSPTLDGAAFGQHLSECISPIVQQVYETQSERAAEVAGALYEISLDLFSKKLLGPAPRSEFIPLAWKELFPLLSHLLDNEPKRLAGAVCNLLLKMENQPGVHTSQWIESMGAISQFCENADEFLQAGEIVAWRCGMAQHRAGALKIAQRLAQTKEPLCRAALGVVEKEMNAAQTIAAYEKNPWWTPAEKDATRRIRRVAGSFRGYESDRNKTGAVFMMPPKVTLHEGQFYAADEENFWLFFADAYGASFHRIGGLMEFSGDPYSPSFGGPLFGANEVPELQHPSSVATDGTTWAVTLPHSYGIYLVA